MVARALLGLPVALLVLLPSGSSRQAEAGFFDVLGDIVSAPFKAAGSLVGAFVGAATAPSIDHLQSAGHTLIADLDGRLQGRIDQISGVLDDKIVKFDNVLGARLADLERITDKAITQLDENMKARIQQIDSAMASRIEQLDGVISRSIADVDGVLAARITQVDELAGRRVGNLDTVVTKAALTFEDGAIRFVGLGCLAVFIAAAVWRMYSEYGKATARAQGGGRFGPTILSVLRPLAWQLPMLAACLGGLYWTFRHLPSTARHERDELTAIHQLALARCLDAADFVRAKYHASQLEVLAPGDARVRASSLKVDLLADLFGRPTMLMSRGSLPSIEGRLLQIETLQGGASGDTHAVRALAVWRLGSTRRHEFEAAAFAAEAIAQGTARDGASAFVLRPLAGTILLNYLSEPLPDETGGTPLGASSMTLRRMQQLGAEARMNEEQSAASPSNAPWLHMIRYCRLTREHQARSTQQYLALLDAHVKVLKQTGPSPEDPTSNSQKDLIQQRAAAAKDLLQLWQRYYSDVRADGQVASSSARYAVFQLNDAVQTRALVYAPPVTRRERPPLVEYVLPPEQGAGHELLALRSGALSALSASPSGIPDSDGWIGPDFKVFVQQDLPQYRDGAAGDAAPLLRGDARELMPVRIRAMEDFGSELGDRSQMLMGLQEARRFEADQTLLREFETAYVCYQLSKGGPSAQTWRLAKQVALRAAQLGLYIGARPYATDALVEDIKVNLPGSGVDDYPARLPVLRRVCSALLEGAKSRTF